MQIKLTGGAYKHPSIDVNSQRCLNYFPVTAGPDGRGESPLLLTGGLKLLFNLGNNNPIRCLGWAGDYVYAVAGASVIRMNINHLTRTCTVLTIGTMASTEGTVSMAANPTQVMWVDGTSTGYIYTVSTNTFETINSVDADFTGGTHVKFLDGYFIVNKPDTGQFYVSALNNGRSWDPLDVATAESGTDNIVGLGVSKGELWVFGETTTEIWYNAANASGSPFSPRDGLEMQMGCGAKDSIVELDDLLIWLDHRGFIVQSNISPLVRDNNSGYDLKIISDEAITTEILSYSRRDDAIAIGYNYRGHLMYQISFPTEQKTWVFDYTTKIWHERSYYNSYYGEHQHHLGQFYTQYETLHLMGGVRDGKVYIHDSIYLDDNGDPIHRIRTSPVLYDRESFRRLELTDVRLRIASGNATSSGDGSDPKVTLRYSKDGGHTWSNHIMRDMGRLGEYAKEIQWPRLGTSREWILEISIVEPIDYSIIEATATVTVEG